MPLVEEHRDGAAEDAEEEDAALVGSDARALLGSRGPSRAGGLRRAAPGWRATGGIIGPAPTGKGGRLGGAARRPASRKDCLARAACSSSTASHELVQVSHVLGRVRAASAPPGRALALAGGGRSPASRGSVGSRRPRRRPRRPAPRLLVHRRLGPARRVQRVPQPRRGQPSGLSSIVGMARGSKRKLGAALEDRRRRSFSSLA